MVLESDKDRELMQDTIIKDVAFFGRSNVGKSSLINAILDKKEFVKTAKAPGKTRSLKFVELNEMSDKANKIMVPRLVDCPGYGFAKASA